MRLNLKSNYNFSYVKHHFKKSEKGITAIDMTISVILIAFFITIITMISGNIQKNNKNLKRETEALYYAIDTIENIKGQNFAILPTMGDNKIQGVEQLSDGYIKDSKGNDTSYYRTILIEDYAQRDSTKEAEVLKIITVNIEYKDNNKEKKVTLSTIKTKEE